ncbi:hypothetical protein M758_1G152300 [Ceratodon purpureus]|uniref:Uncharacterized protein n=1 Tax=Ceratodon purpureus TaxID=3225 RepID=A0A8T0J7G9_CERPU|nr:hypothetical protein KC19_1G155600 [Ceratodon purpureus]KAG0630074.1 hypothetical protein M758_1G152300 [Ceratodon purpureus]
MMMVLFFACRSVLVVLHRLCFRGVISMEVAYSKAD